MKFKPGDKITLRSGNMCNILESRIKDGKEEYLVVRLSANIFEWVPVSSCEDAGEKLCESLDDFAHLELSQEELNQEAQLLEQFKKNVIKAD